MKVHNLDAVLTLQQEKLNPSLTALKVARDFTKRHGAHRESDAVLNISAEIVAQDYWCHLAPPHMRSNPSRFIKDGQARLISAIKSNDLETAEFLLNSGVDPNVITIPLFHAVIAENLEMVKLLQLHGADVHALDTYNQTALLIAASRRHYAIAEYLVKECNADVNTPNIKGVSPLMFSSHNGDTVTARLLIEHGADVNHLDANKKSAFDYAHINRKLSLAWYLVENGAKINGHKGILNLAVISNASVLVIDNISQQATQEERQAAFITAASYNRLNILLYYKVSGIDVNRTDPSSGLTALACAAANGHTESAEYLIEHGADVRSRDNEGNEPIMRAKSFPMVELLIARGANVMALNDRTDARRYKYNAVELSLCKGANPEVKQAMVAEDYWQRLTCRQQRGDEPSRFI